MPIDRVNRGEGGKLMLIKGCLKTAKGDRFSKGSEDAPRRCETRHLMAEGSTGAVTDLRGTGEGTEGRGSRG